MTTSEWIEIDELKVAPSLYAFVNEEALPGTGVAAEHFWQELQALLSRMAPRRDDLRG